MGVPYPGDDSLPPDILVFTPGLVNSDGDTFCVAATDGIAYEGEAAAITSVLTNKQVVSTTVQTMYTRLT